MDDAPHIPVMLKEVCEYMNPQDGGIYVDGTFGAGGYTRALLDQANCSVIAIDRDETALVAAQNWIGSYGDRLKLVHGSFGDLKNHLLALNIEKVDGIVLDVGVSSMQIDQAERGFSFRFDGALDMRMDASQGETAADIVNSYKEEALANLIYQYGEERLSRRIAKTIVKNRPIGTTLQLADIVRSVVPRSKKSGLDPATRTFQALRIAVNDELGQLEELLDSTPDLLKKGGRLLVVSFHSLEDKIVKNFMRGQRIEASRYEPVVNEYIGSNYSSPFLMLSKKAFLPSKEECLSNPRSRSARLRVAERLEE